MHWLSPKPTLARLGIEPATQARDLDLESTPQPFGLQADAAATEPHGPGHETLASARCLAPLLWAVPGRWHIVAATLFLFADAQSECKTQKRAGSSQPGHSWHPIYFLLLNQGGGGSAHTPGRWSPRLER